MMNQKLRNRLHCTYEQQDSQQRTLPVDSIAYGQKSAANIAVATCMSPTKRRLELSEIVNADQTVNTNLSGIANSAEQVHGRVAHDKLISSKHQKQASLAVGESYYRGAVSRFSIGSSQALFTGNNSQQALFQSRLSPTKKKQPTIARKQLPTDFFTSVKKPVAQAYRQLVKQGEPLRAKHLFRSPDNRLGGDQQSSSKIGALCYNSIQKETKDYSLTIPKRKDGVEPVVMVRSCEQLDKLPITASDRYCASVGDGLACLDTTWPENCNQQLHGDAEILSLQMHDTPTGKTNKNNQIHEFNCLELEDVGSAAAVVSHNQKSSNKGNNSIQDFQAGCIPELVQSREFMQSAKDLDHQIALPPLNVRKNAASTSKRYANPKVSSKGLTMQKKLSDRSVVQSQKAPREAQIRVEDGNDNSRVYDNNILEFKGDKRLDSKLSQARIMSRQINQAFQQAEEFKPRESSRNQPHNYSIAQYLKQPVTFNNDKNSLSRGQNFLWNLEDMNSSVNQQQLPAQSVHLVDELNSRSQIRVNKMQSASKPLKSQRLLNNRESNRKKIQMAQVSNSSEIIKKCLTTNYSGDNITNSNIEVKYDNDNDIGTAGVRLPKIEGVRNTAVHSCNPSPQNPVEVNMNKFIPAKYNSFVDKSKSFLNRLRKTNEEKSFEFMEAPVSRLIQEGQDCSVVAGEVDINNLIDRQSSFLVKTEPISPARQMVETDNKMCKYINSKIQQPPHTAANQNNQQQKKQLLPQSGKDAMTNKTNKSLAKRKERKDLSKFLHKKSQSVMLGNSTENNQDPFQIYTFYNAQSGSGGGGEQQDTARDCTKIQHQQLQHQQYQQQKAAVIGPQKDYDCLGTTITTTNIANSPQRDLSVFNQDSRHHETETPCFSKPSSIELGSYTNNSTTRNNSNHISSFIHQSQQTACFALGAKDDSSTIIDNQKVKGADWPSESIDTDNTSCYRQMCCNQKTSESTDNLLTTSDQLVQSLPQSAIDAFFDQSSQQ